jgi:hypothetical protein
LITGGYSAIDLQIIARNGTVEWYKLLEIISSFLYER